MLALLRKYWLVVLFLLSPFIFLAYFSLDKETKCNPVHEAYHSSELRTRAKILHSLISDEDKISEMKLSTYSFECNIGASIVGSELSSMRTYDNLWDSVGVPTYCIPPIVLIPSLSYDFNPKFSFYVLGYDNLLFKCKLLVRDGYCVDEIDVNVFFVDELPVYMDDNSILFVYDDFNGKIPKDVVDRELIKILKLKAAMELI